MKDKKPKKIRGKKPKAQTKGRTASKKDTPASQAEPIQPHEVFKLAMKVLEELSANKEIRALERLRDKQIQEHLSDINYAREEGRREGMAKTVLKLFEQGAVDASAVKKATGFSIKKLRKEASKTIQVD